MIKFKQWSLMIGVAAVMLLSACGQKLSHVQTSYEHSDVVAVIKGDAATQGDVTYKTPTTRGKVKVDGGQFRIAVPTTTRTQSITVQAGGQKLTRHVRATPALGKYTRIATKYNQALAVAVLPKSVQVQIKQMTAMQTQVSSLPPAQQLALMQTEAQLKQALAKAQTATKAQQLPATVNGQRKLFAKQTSPMHLNVQDGHLMSVTIAMTPAALKSKPSLQQLGMQLELLATATGANAQQVGTQLQAIMKSGSMTNLSRRTISSHGVKFHLGTTLTEMYVLVTK